MAKVKMLVFGGPGLAPHQHTWYDQVLEDGTTGNRIVAQVGDKVPFDSVLDADGYVTRGQASVVNGTIDKAVLPASATGDINA